MLSILLNIGPIANAHGENCIFRIELKQLLAVIVVGFDKLFTGFNWRINLRLAIEASKSLENVHLVVLNPMPWR